MTPLDSYRLALDYSCYCLVLTQTFLDEEDDIINPKVVRFFLGLIHIVSIHIRVSTIWEILDYQKAVQTT